MRYEPTHIANFMLRQAAQEGRSLTQMKLQKLVYIAYGWYLALTGKQLFDEQIQAWQHGPVIRSIYDEFKDFGKKPIDRMSVSFDMEQLDTVTPEVPEEDDEANIVLKKVWDIYKDFSAWDLREKTHESNTPWDRAYTGGRADVIDPDVVRSHFESKIDEYLGVTAED